LVLVVLVVFLALQLAEMAQIQFWRLSHLLAAVVVELKTAMALLAAQAAVAVETEPEQQELQTKALLAVMAPELRVSAVAAAVRVLLVL
jgi:hypothetical protein